MTPLPCLRDIGRRHGARIGGRDVSFDPNPSGMTGTLGESGPGMFALLSCLAGRLAPDRGRVIFDPRPLAADRAVEVTPVTPALAA